MSQEPSPPSPASLLKWTHKSVGLLLSRVTFHTTFDLHNPHFVRHPWLDAMAGVEFIRAGDSQVYQPAWYPHRILLTLWNDWTKEAYQYLFRTFNDSPPGLAATLAEDLIRWGFEPEADHTFIYYGYILAGNRIHLTFCRRSQLPAHLITSD